MCFESYGLVGLQPFDVGPQVKRNLPTKAGGGKVLNDPWCGWTVSYWSCDSRNFLDAIFVVSNSSSSHWSMQVDDNSAARHFLDRSAKNRDASVHCVSCLL